MISPEQQQLDEALTVAGHSDACSAFELGRACSGTPVCNGVPIAGVPSGMSLPLFGHHPLDQGTQATPTVTLSGPSAIAFEAYKAAARDLKTADQAHRAAQERYHKAHQAFAEATAAE